MHWLRDIRLIFLLTASVGWYGFQESFLWWNCESQPQEMTLFHLTQSSGSHPNRNIAIAEYELPDFHVAWDDDENGIDEVLEFPLLTPSGNVTGRPVICRYFVPDGETFHYFDDPLVGLITSDVTGFDSESKRLMEQEYPHISFDDPLVIEVNRSLPNPLIFLPAVGFCLLGLAWCAFLGVQSMIT